MGKDRTRVCGICGKIESKGWYKHYIRKHKNNVKIEL
jgi:hypothetical protein